jgi:purine catabolism regulator
MPTVTEVLEFPSLRRGRPEVVAGAQGLARRVRWLHVSELPTIAQLLRGGELILTTGIAMPDDDRELVRYVSDLTEVGAVGVIVGLGPRYMTELPAALVRAAERYGLPLVVLRRTMPFVEITEDVHGRIVDTQVDELRTSERIHRIFNELAVEGAPTSEILHQVTAMAGAPVVLENLAHQVLAHDVAGQPPEDVIGDWEQRSRRIAVPGRTGYDPASRCLVTAVGARGQDWGRLVLLTEGDEAPRFEMLLERAASTLALARLLARDQENLELVAHGSILVRVLSPKQPVSELALEAKAVGVPLDNRRLVGVALRHRNPVPKAGLEQQARLRALAESASAAVRVSGIPALVGGLDGDVVAALLSLRRNGDDSEALRGFVAGLRRSGVTRDVVVGVGAPALAVADARRSLLEAMQVADAALHLSEDRDYFQMPDLHLRGLLQLLRDDIRLQTFAERELLPLLEHDEKHGTSLTPALRAYLMSGRNKTAASELAHVSRPWMYEQLTKIERVLGVDLESEEVCVSLQVALMAFDAVRTG